jgi:hypothetical protein
MPDYCGRYGAPFEVDLDYGEVRPDEMFEGGVTDSWKYRSLYPLSSHQYGFELRLVQLQDRFRLMGYSMLHENSHLRTFVFG